MEAAAGRRMAANGNPPPLSPAGARAGLEWSTPPINDRRDAICSRLGRVETTRDLALDRVRGRLVAWRANLLNTQ